MLSPYCLSSKPAFMKELFSLLYDRTCPHYNFCNSVDRVECLTENGENVVLHGLIVDIKWNEGGGMEVERQLTEGDSVMEFKLWNAVYEEQ